MNILVKRLERKNANLEKQVAALREAVDEYERERNDLAEKKRKYEEVIERFDEYDAKKQKELADLNRVKGEYETLKRQCAVYLGELKSISKNVKKARKNSG